MKLAFTKMQGCANDYIYLDCRAAGLPPSLRTPTPPCGSSTPTAAKG